MHSAFIQETDQPLIPIIPLSGEQLPDWLTKQPRHVQAWIENEQFEARSATYCKVPANDGSLHAILLGLKNANDFWAFGALPTCLQKGQYEIQDTGLLTDQAQWQLASLGWGLGHYQFSKYKKRQPREAQLLLPSTVDADWLENCLDTIYLSRDLINTPAEDMGPQAIEDAVKAVAKTFSASVNVIHGDKLTAENYPAIHAVGRASLREPRMIDLRWGKKDAPKITLVGKGVCFDSGGLDLKTPSGMLLMKKDMGGSAMMLGLARMIMSEQLPVQLRLLIGAVENSVSGNAYRPGDVIKTRAGKTVEVKNTDAEGRLVLCDLLAEASTESPEIIIDFATLTGAARIALGEDIPAMYSNQQTLANDLLQSAEKTKDPIWQLPLFVDYKDKLKSEIADLSNCALDSPWGGSITAALFLQDFVGENIPWAHFDVPAWCFKSRPGRPVGADVFAIRAVFDYLRNKYQ